MSENKPIGELHVFAQYCEHDEARIVGTRLGLEALATAIKKALKYGHAESDHVFTNDGEGYRVLVTRAEDIDALPAPYLSHYETAELAEWRNRAFTAEAKLYRLRKIEQPAPPSP